MERDAETNKDVFVNDATQQRLGTHPVRLAARTLRLADSLGFDCRCSTRRLKLIEKDFSCSNNNNNNSNNNNNNRREGKKKTVFSFLFSLLCVAQTSFD